jgi:O-antigen/teichoic acid export membrane protein
MSLRKELKHVVSFLEKWTELDVLYFLRGGAWLFSTQFFVILSSFSLYVGFAHLASKDMFGQFQFVLSVIATLSVLCLPGTNTAVMLGSAQNLDGSLGRGVRLKLRWSILGMIGLAVAAWYFYSRQYSAVWPAFLVAIPLFPLLYSLDSANHFFAGKKKFSLVCLFQLLTDAGSAVAALVALLLTRNLLVVVGAFLLFQVIGDVLAYYAALRLARNKKVDPEFASYSTHLSLINLIPGIRMHFDKLIATYYLGFAATAVYTIGAAMAEQLYAVSKNVGNMIFPKVSVGTPSKVYAEVRKRIGKLVFFFIVVAIAAIVLAPFIIPFFFSAEYDEAVPIAQLMLLATIPRAVAFVLSRVQEALKQKGKLYKINMVYALVEILAMVVLVPMYGLYGVVGAKIVSNVVYLAAAILTLR